MKMCTFWRAGIVSSVYTAKSRPYLYEGTDLHFFSLCYQPQSLCCPTIDIILAFHRLANCLYTAHVICELFASNHRSLLDRLHSYPAQSSVSVFSLLHSVCFPSFSPYFLFSYFVSAFHLYLLFHFSLFLTLSFTRIHYFSYFH